MGKRRGQNPSLANDQKLTRWNGTAKQGAQWKRERDLKNKIHELEEKLSASERMVANLTVALNDAKRARDNAVPTGKRLRAMQAFAVLPITSLVELGLADHGLELAKWALELRTLKTVTP